MQRLTTMMPGTNGHAFHVQRLQRDLGLLHRSTDASAPGLQCGRQFARPGCHHEAPTGCFGCAAQQQLDAGVVAVVQVVHQQHAAAAQHVGDRRFEGTGLQLALVELEPDIATVEGKIRWKGKIEFTRWERRN